MKHLDQLRAQLKAKIAELDAFDAKDAPTEADIEALEKTNKEIASLEAQIKTLEDAAAAKARSTKPADEPIEPEQQRVAAEPEEKLTKSDKTGLIAMAIAASHFERKDSIEPRSPMKILADAGYQKFAGEVSKEAERRREVIRTLNASSATQGGILVPDMQSADIVELLRPETAFLRGNPRRVPMPNGVFRQPGAASGSQATYRAEGARILTTEPTFREVNMSAKFLGAIVPMTRQVLDFSIGGVRQFVENDLRAAMAEAMDLNALFGDGTEGAPLGLANRVGVITSVSPGGTTTATLAEIDTTFRAANMAFFSRNIRNMGRWAMIMNPRTLLYLSSKRVGSDDGQFAYPTLQGATPMMGSIPVFTTTQVPINLGGGADESYILLVNFEDVLFGVQEGLMLATSNEATIYHNGEWVSAFQNDLVFLRATHAHDVGLRRPESVIVIDAVRWGA